MLEIKYRPLIQATFINPIAKLVGRYFSPNILTLLSLVIGILSAFCIAVDWRWLAVLLLLLSGYLDILDGSVARITHTSSSMGTILDIMSDRTVEVFIFIAFAIRSPDLALLFMFMMGSTLLCVSSFLVVGIFSSNTTSKSFYYSPGLIERAEAFIFFIIIILFKSWETWSVVIYIILVLWTAGYRLFEFYHNIKRSEL